MLEAVRSIERTASESGSEIPRGERRGSLFSRKRDA